MSSLLEELAHGPCIANLRASEFVSVTGIPDSKLVADRTPDKITENTNGEFAVDNKPLLQASDAGSARALLALTDFPCSAIRQPLSVNLFKQMVLGERHRVGDPQTEAIREAFLEQGLADRLDWRTWPTWFGPKASGTRRSSAEELDRFLDSKRDAARYRNFPGATPTTQFFVDLISGGLVRELQKKTTSKQPLAVLRQRAADYSPASPWHLHLDAVEAASVSDGNEDVGWQDVKSIAASRILELLHERWGPRHGYVYKQFSSDRRVAWIEANETEREKIRASCSQLPPQFFDHDLKAPARPAWSAIGVEPDIAPLHVHRTLLALAADVDFLKFDRFEEWSLDLATAGLAMHALAWVDRYATYAVRMQPEVVYWRALEMLYIGEEPEAEKLYALQQAMELAGSPWSEKAGAKLLKAGSEYRRSLMQLDVTPSQMAAMANACWSSRPLVYQG